MGFLTLFVGGPQLLLLGATLLNGISLAGKAGLTPSGCIAGVGIPAAVFACVCVALKFAWDLRQERSRNRAAYTLAACLSLEWILYGLLFFLVLDKGTQYASTIEWLVSDPRGVPPNEILGRSLAINVGIFGPVFFSGCFATLPLLPLLLAIVFLDPSARGTLGWPNHHGSESAKANLQSEFKEPGGDLHDDR